MPKVNWKVRLRHPAFYTAIVGFVGFIISDSGVMDLGRFEMYAQLFFGVLVAAGVITDLTTPGIRDSKLALTKEKPIDGEDLNNGGKFY